VVLKSGLLLAYKVKFTASFHLLRGNHECSFLGGLREGVAADWDWPMVGRFQLPLDHSGRRAEDFLRPGPALAAPGVAPQAGAPRMRFAAKTVRDRLRTPPRARGDCAACGRARAPAAGRVGVKPWRRPSDHDSMTITFRMIHLS
jgi:hypothetical protein